MFRDVTNVQSDTDCVIILNDKTLQSFSTTDTTQYELVSNQYFASKIMPTSIPGDYQCYTIAQIQTLPSTYDFITPVYHLMAIISITTIVFLAYKLILYPFFRTKL